MEQQKQQQQQPNTQEDVSEDLLTYTSITSLPTRQTTVASTMSNNSTSVDIDENSETFGDTNTTNSSIAVIAESKQHPQHSQQKQKREEEGYQKQKQQPNEQQTFIKNKSSTEQNQQQESKRKENESVGKDSREEDDSVSTDTLHVPNNKVQEQQYKKNYFEDSEEYKIFKEWVALKKIMTYTPTTKTWSYYEYGPKDQTPLICIGGICSSGDSFFQQILSLASKGFRLLSVTLPPFISHDEFVLSFENFLSSIGITHIHMCGVGLGGFLAQIFAESKPQYVDSLILANTFCDSKPFHENAPCLDMFQLMPGFILKKIILNAFPTKPVELMICRSIDFMIDKLEEMAQKLVASRLILNCSLRKVKKLSLSNEKITIIDCLDDLVITQPMRDELDKLYPNARKALMKSGGSFPYLSRAEEFNMYIQVHLRRVSQQSDDNDIHQTSSESEQDINASTSDETSNDPRLESTATTQSTEQ